MRVAQIAVLVCGGLGASGASVQAECAALDVSALKRGAAVVFEGTVTHLEVLPHGESEATVDVHRVWKGKTSNPITVWRCFTIRATKTQFSGRR